MKRSVFILAFLLAGLRLLALSPASLTTLPVAHCDALSVKPKIVLSMLKPNVFQYNIDKKDCVLEPLKSNYRNNTNVIHLVHAFILPERIAIKPIRSFDHHRKKINAYKPHVSKHTFNKVLVPP